MATIQELGIKSLYKFKSFDKDDYYQDILRNILFFPSSSQLNDPFDSQIPLRYDLCTKQELIKLGKNIYPPTKMFSRQERRKSSREAAKIFKKNMKENPSLLELRTKDFVEANIKVFSLTENINNLLLWSHYSASHKGFCIEFSARLLNNFFINSYLKMGIKAIIDKVNYQVNYPIIHPFKNTYYERMHLELFTKSKDWDYEDEWRILILDQKKNKINILPEVITNIYFGLLASEENIKTSMAILKSSNPEIDIYKAVKKKDEFGLDFEKLNWE